MTYVALLRAINVGGTGIMKMAPLRTCFEDAGLTRVATYIHSGNIIFDSERSAAAVTGTVEAALSAAFGCRGDDTGHATSTIPTASRRP